MRTSDEGTCFTRAGYLTSYALPPLLLAQVNVLRASSGSVGASDSGTRFTFFTGTKVQILTLEKLPETNGLRASSGSLPDPSGTPRSSANPPAGRGSTGMQPMEFPYRPALPALPTVFRPATPTHGAGSVSSNWGAPLAPLSGGKSNAFVPLSSLGPGGSTSAASRPLMFTGAPVGGRGGGSGAGASGQGVGGVGAVAAGASWDPRYSVYLLH